MANWLICLLFSFSPTLQLRLWLIRRCYEATDRMVSSYLCLVLNPCRQCTRKALVLILSTKQHSNNKLNTFPKTFYLACFGATIRTEFVSLSNPGAVCKISKSAVFSNLQYLKVFPLCFHGDKMFPFFFFQFFTSFYELVRRWALITTIYKEINPWGRTRCIRRIHRHTCIIHDTPFRTLWL